MCAKTTPEIAISFVRKTVCFSLYWPVDADASKLWKLIRKFLKFLNFMCTILTFPALLYGAYYSLQQNDNVRFTSVAISSMACCHVLGQTGVCFFLHDHLQLLVAEMVKFFRTMKPYEREIYQCYVDKYSTFYWMCTAWNTLTVLSVDIGALFTEQLLPLMAKYPFPVDHEPVRSIILVKQLCFSIQCLATLNLNIMVAMLLLFAAGRFKILMIDLHRSTSIDEVKKCLEQYQKIRELGLDVVHGVEYMIIFTLLTSSGNVVLAGLNLIAPQANVGRLQSILLAGSSLVEVYMCALPADVLMEMSEATSGSVYEAKWYDLDLKAKKVVLQMLVPQNAVVVTLKCMMSALSLNYYSAYVSNAFSIFTTLRIVMYNDLDTVNSCTSGNNTCNNN